MPSGHYSVTVDSYGAPYPNQFAQVDLGAGQEAFVEVLSKREKVGGPEGSRAAYFTEPVPADVARAAIGAIPFYGSRWAVRGVPRRRTCSSGSSAPRSASAAMTANSPATRPPSPGTGRRCGARPSDELREGTLLPDDRAE